MIENDSSAKLIDVGRYLRQKPVLNKFYPLVEQPFEKLLSLDRINATYRRLSETSSDSLNFFSACLHLLNISLDIQNSMDARLPEKGPLIVIGNHPFGGLDGIILSAFISGFRQDVKILGNYFLGAIPEIRPSLIAVDPFESAHAVTRNTAPLKDTLHWLKKGGALIVFPAGEVSSLQIRQGQVTDKIWSPHVASLIRHSRASVLPVFFSGRNSNLFNLLGLLHPRFRTMLLPRELMQMKSSSVRLTVGSVIPYSHLSGFDSDRAIADHLRLKTFILKNRTPRPQDRALIKSGVFFRTRPLAPLLPAIPKNRIAEEITALSDTQKMVRHGDFSVFIASASQIPNLLNEIGRLREKTFREVGEGTGKNIDLDRFDQHYLHLFVWNHRSHEIVGGYRLGQSDKIISRYSTRGLYCSTLFRFKNGFLKQLGPGLEMGRSFVSTDYQKHYSSLWLLWRGIGQYIARNPKYNILFGPVSISNDYHTVSRKLMVQFLKDTRNNQALSRYVKPKNPVRHGRIRLLDKETIRSGLKSIDHVSAAIEEIEQDRKGVPVLLRHYLKLNASFLSFNRDKKFSNVIDGLLVVDLLKTDQKLLKRFMGVDGHNAFMQHYGTTVKQGESA